MRSTVQISHQKSYPLQVAIGAIRLNRSSLRVKCLMSLLWGRKNNPKGKIVLIPGDVDWLAKAKGCLSFAFVHKHIHIHKDTCCRPTVWIRLHCWGQRQKASQQKTPTGRQASEGRGMATWVQRERERERYVTKIGHIFGIFNIRENCELNLKWLKANFCHAKLQSFAQAL